jgi:hypothetical protein
MQVLRSPRGSVCFGRWFGWALLGAQLAVPGVGYSGQTPDLERVPRSEVQAEPGDSWSSIRTRICPIELLQSANPGLADRNLRPGDVIRSPFVSAEELEKAKTLYNQSEARLQKELERRSDLEARVASFESLQRELAQVRESEAGAKRTSAALVGATGVATVLFLIALVLALVLRQESERLNRRLVDAEERYNDLRRSLQALEVHLQKRMLELVGVHKGHALNEEQVHAAVLPVIEMAERLKRRHAS